MVRTEHDIVQLVYAAKTDPAAADALVQQYLPFVRSETVKFTHAAIEAGHEDALSVALLAFYEAILSYERSRGAFVPYAARAIRNRLIDQYRAERRHRGHVSLQAPSGTDDRDLEQTLPEKENPVEASELRLASAGKSRSSAPSWRNSAFLFPTWRTTAPSRTAPWMPAAGSWPMPARRRTCWNAWCRLAACRWQN